MKICYKVGNKYFDDENLAVEYEKEYFAKREAENKFKAEKEAKEKELKDAWRKVWEDYDNFRDLCIKYKDAYNIKNYVINRYLIQDFFD